MTTLATLLLSLAGFAALAASMTKHHRDLFGMAPPRGRKRALTASGWLLLAAALFPAIKDQGVSVGIVLWLGVTTVAALGAALLLTYRALWWRG